MIVHEHELAETYRRTFGPRVGYGMSHRLLTGVGWVRLQDMSLPSELPIVQAPMAGGTSTPRLCNKPELNQFLDISIRGIPNDL